MVTFVRPISFDALESLESPKSWPERRIKTAKTRVLGLWRSFSQKLFSNFFFNLCYGLLMVPFDKPISFVALESLEVGHFRPERLK